jgi:hypothetical protein
MKIKQTAVAGALASIIAMPAFAELDTGGAQASANVAIFAAITQLDNFVLENNIGVDGAANATYVASEPFNLESNAQVRVTIAAGSMTNGSDTLSTIYRFENGTATLDTETDSVHNQEHYLNVTSVLGEISDQKAGDYAADVLLTVSAL